MHFEFTHEFDTPTDALELAVLSPHLIEKLGPRLKNVDHVEQSTHSLLEGELERVWKYLPNVKIPAFAHSVITKEMCGWEERSRYRLASHDAEWTVTPNVKPEWQKYFRASGVYRIVPGADGRSQRVVSGDVVLELPRVIADFAERLIVSEVKKIFETEAEVLAEMATLA